MSSIEIGQLIAQLGLIPALGIALVVMWRKWWAMVDKLVTKYEAVIEKKDKVIKDLTEKNEKLGEKRLEEYREMVNDYRTTLEETNRRDEKLADGQQANQRLLEAIAGRPAGGTS
jgi:F0F1-type ATP synthase membrane subunit b/b'